jgi:hypothetical protein
MTDAGPALVMPVGGGEGDEIVRTLVGHVDAWLIEANLDYANHVEAQCQRRDAAEKARIADLARQFEAARRMNSLLG